MSSVTTCNKKAMIVDTSSMEDLHVGSQAHRNRLRQARQTVDGKLDTEDGRHVLYISRDREGCRNNTTARSVIN